jgi:hypothetical protein
MHPPVLHVRMALPAVLATAAVAACEGGPGVEAFGGVPQSAAVASIVINPSSATLTAIGALQQFTAIAEDSSGQAVGGVSFTWSSLDTTVVTVSAGLARAVGNGTTGVVAEADGVTGTANVNVSTP